MRSVIGGVVWLAWAALPRQRPSRERLRSRWGSGACDTTDTGLGALTDVELTRAWTYTTRALGTDLSPGRRLTVVSTRQYLLDELWARGLAPRHDQQ